MARNDAYVPRHSMEWIPARAQRKRRARATRDHTRGMMPIPRRRRGRRTPPPDSGTLQDGPRSALARASDSGAAKALRGGLSLLLAGLAEVLGIVLGGLRELGAFWLRVAEILGTAVLSAWRRVWPILVAALEAGGRCIAVVERVVTPSGTVAVVTAGAALLLATSQFIDYRGVEIGAPAYQDVQAVAPAPQTDRQTMGSVHGYAMLPVAAVALVALAFALGGRWRLGRVISLLGALTIAVSLLFDARRGLEEGEAALAYQGAHAVLIEGFWVQLSSAAVLLIGGLLVTRYVRLARGMERGRLVDRPARRRRRQKRAGIAGVRA
jgi:hypothetical protein